MKRDVPGYSQFQVDSDLNIYRNGIPVICNTPDNGYAFIADGNGGAIKRATIICAAFHGPKPFARAEVAHWDGNPGNDHPSNLRWASHSENMKDVNRYNPGWRAGERNGRCVLSDADVAEIRTLYGLEKSWRKTWSQKKLAELYGVGQTQISRIVRGEQRGVC